MRNSIFSNTLLYRDTAGASQGNAFTEHGYKPEKTWGTPSRTRGKKYAVLGLTAPEKNKPGSIVIEPRGGGEKRSAMLHASI
ncbi:MAG: hypothetical protein KGI71_04015 [Patescibacteria group bacterium]|nr:hypothetical protein [Patescibacteria group bacterium]